jgi:type VI protein secretion system component VasF
VVLLDLDRHGGWRRRSWPRRSRRPDHFRKLDAQSTIEDIQTSAEAVRSDFDAFKTAAGNLASDQVKAIEDAVCELQSAAQAIPDTDTVEQAIQALVPQVEAIEAARAEAGTADCGEVAVEARASAAAAAVDEVRASLGAAASGAAEAASDAMASLEAALESLTPDSSPAS